MSYHDIVSNKVKRELKLGSTFFGSVQSRAKCHSLQKLKRRCSSFALLTTMIVSLELGEISLLNRWSKILIFSALIFLALRFK